jgi:hypothetical protein
VTDVLAEGVYRKNISIRANSVYALAMLGYRHHAAILETALPHAIQHDPLLLPRVISELSWISRSDRMYVDLHAAASSPLYLSRWAALAVTAHHGIDPDNSGGLFRERRARLLRRLAGDDHPWIRGEATYQLAELELLSPRETLSRSERRRRYRELRRNEPDATFDSLEVSFLNYLSTFKYPDYTIAQLEAFSEFVFRQPRSKTFGDSIDLYRAFDSLWRGTNETDSNRSIDVRT